MYKDMTTYELEKLISLKKIKLNKLLEQQGLSDRVLKQSQELDEFIVEIQTRKLAKIQTNRIDINKK